MTLSKEIEIRKKSTNPDKLLKILEKEGVKVTDNEYQKDDYFMPVHRDFLEKDPVEEWFRVRQSPQKASITYKNWKFVDGKSKNICDEFQTAISNSEDFLKILTALNFKKIVTVEKTRNSWLYKGIEISVDDVKDLGVFVELENKELKGDDDEIVAQLNILAEDLELVDDPAMLLGYPKALIKMLD